MSENKPVTPPKRIRFYYSVLVVLSGAYIYFGLVRGYWLELAAPYMLVLSAVGLLATRFGIVRFPKGVRIPLVTHFPNTIHLAKAVLCGAFGVIWAVVIGRLVNDFGWDNWIGVPIVFGPPIFMSVIAALYFVKALGYRSLE